MAKKESGPKENQLRAMREAKYEQQQRATADAKAKAAAPKAKPAKAKAKAKVAPKVVKVATEPLEVKEESTSTVVVVQDWLEEIEE